MSLKHYIIATTFLPLVVSCSATNGILKRANPLSSGPGPKPNTQAQKAPEASPEDGAFHIVGKGETLRHVCEVYGLDLTKVARINKILPPYALKVGETIFLPAQALLSEKETRRAGIAGASGASQPEALFQRNLAGALRGRKDPSVPPLVFPVPGGVLSSPFGYRWGRFHRGLDIAAPLGNPVIACAEGRVMFVGSRKGFRRYGNTVLIDHGKGVYTYYAHLGSIAVKKNQKVRKGQHIAAVGNTGRSTGPHLHLEVRVVNTMYNPIAYFSPGELSGTRLAKRFSDSPMGPVRAHWGIPDLLSANH